ncbi:hypothetical protein D3C72_1740590 [compost metagenome]
MSDCLLSTFFRSGFLPTVVLLPVVSRLRSARSCFWCASSWIVMVPSAMALCATPSWLPLRRCGIIGLMPPVFLSEVGPLFFSAFCGPAVMPADTPNEVAL